jgi:5'-3' exonuclease
LEPAELKFDHAIIDSDILVYRIGFTTEDVDEGIARWRMNELIRNILAKTQAPKATFFLTADNQSNFRFKLYADYKANRKNKPKPSHYKFLRGYLQDEFYASVIENEEADDALAQMLSEKSSEHRVLCTIDKDLDQVPGWHYNFVDERFYNISELESWRAFYTQCLVGDQVDNIDGCPGIGKVKSNKMLEGCLNENEMLEVVLKAYLKAYSSQGEDEAIERLLLAGNLLWVRREPNQPWVRPSGEVNSKISLKNLLQTLDGNTSTNQINSLT